MRAFLLPQEVTTIMGDELKDFADQLAGTVATMATTIEEMKAEKEKGHVPAELLEKIDKISEDVQDFSKKMARLDEEPAFKRAFGGEIQVSGGMTFETKLRIPSAKSQDEDMRELFELQDTVQILSFMKRRDQNFRVEDTQAWKRMQELYQRKAYEGYSGGSGSGAAWIPTGYSPDLIMKFELERMIASKFEIVNMPNDPFRIPRQTSRGKIYKKSRGVAVTKSKAGDDYVDLSTTTLAGYQSVAYEMEEDSIIAMVPFIRSDLAMDMADGEENLILNGDTTATHQDADVTDDDDALTSWKGLRKLSKDGSDTYDFGGNAPTLLSLRAMRSQMGKYGINPRRLLYIVSPVGLVHLLNVDEVQTLDKYGPAATVITGEIGRIDGVPILVSGYIREDLNASGDFDGTTKTFTGIQLVNPSGFVIGRRRAPLMESFHDVIAGSDELVVSMREDFQKRYPTTEALSMWGHNIPNTITETT